VNELDFKVTATPLALGSSAGAPSIAARWYVLLMMCGVYTLSIADRYVISTVLEPIRLELHLSDAGIGLLSGVFLGVCYVSFGFPLSWLIDRRSRRNIIGICLAAWSVLTVLTGISRTYWQLLLSRIGVGVGEAGGTPGASSILSDYFPAARRPMALTIFSLGAPIGAWIGADLAGAIADRYGWRSVFICLGIPGIIAALLVLVTVREPRRGSLDATDDGPAPTVLETLCFLWRQRSAVHIIIGTALAALWGWGLMWWTQTFLQRNYGLTMGGAGAITGPIHLIGGSVATLATGWLMARPSMRDPRRIVRLLGVGLSIGTVASAFIYSTHSLAVVKGLLWIFIPSIYFYIGPGFGLLNNLAQPRMRAVFCAMVLFLANVGNLVIAPWLVGFLSDVFGHHHMTNAESLRLAMLCLVPTGFWCAAHLFWSARDVVGDQERATGIRAASGAANA